MTPSEVVAGLRSLPNELGAVLDGLTDSVMRARPSSEAWSVLEVCCHLRDAARQEIGRIERMAREDDPFIDTWDQEALARERAYNADYVAAVRAAMIAAWTELASMIERLPADAWQRTGRHPEFGVITIAWRAQRQVEHPREHFASMRESIAAARSEGR